MGHYLAANGIEGAAKQRSVFLALIGPRTYKLLGSLVAPKKPGEKSYAELVEALAKHFDLQPSEIVQRYCFHTRFRQSGVTVATCLSELRSLAQKCNFKANTLSERLVVA